MDLVSNDLSAPRSGASNRTLAFASCLAPPASVSTTSPSFRSHASPLGSPDDSQSTGSLSVPRATAPPPRLIDQSPSCAWRALSDNLSCTLLSSAAAHTGVCLVGARNRQSFAGLWLRIVSWSQRIHLRLCRRSFKADSTQFLAPELLQAPS